MSKTDNLEGLIDSLESLSNDMFDAGERSVTGLRAFALTCTGESGWSVEFMVRKRDGMAVRGEIAESTPAHHCAPWAQGLLSWMKRSAVTLVSVDSVSGLLDWDGYIEREARVERVEFKLPT